MKDFLWVKGEVGSRKTTFILLAICGASLAITLFIGISDNPPGILLCFLAAIALILAFVHTWRKAKYFLILLGVSLIGFFVFVVLHNLFWSLGQMAEDITILKNLLNFIDAVSFLVALLVCPAGCLIGAVGSLIMYLKERKLPV
jgi:hypothetical protein